MLNAKKIKDVMSKKKIAKAVLCKDINIGRTTLDAILNGGDTRISTIEAIANYLQIGIGYLFDETPAEHYEQHGERSVMARNIDRVEMGDKVQDKVDEVILEQTEVIGEPQTPTAPDLSKMTREQLYAEIARLNGVISEEKERFIRYVTK